MPQLAVNLPQDLKTRLEALAMRTGCSVGHCMETAVLEFVEQWEAHLRDIGTMDPPVALPEAANF